MNHFIFYTAALGLLFCLQYSWILKVPREWLSARLPIFKRLIGCSMCSGFWVGLFLGVVWQIQMNGVSFIPSLFYAFSVSFLGNFVDLAMKALDEWVFKNSTKQE